MFFLRKELLWLLRHLQSRVDILESERRSQEEFCRRRDEAARNLEGTLRSKESFQISDVIGPRHSFIIIYIYNIYYITI